VLVLESSNVQRRGIGVIEAVVSTSFEPLLYLLHNKITDCQSQRQVWGPRRSKGGWKKFHNCVKSVTGTHIFTKAYV